MRSCKFPVTVAAAFILSAGSFAVPATARSDLPIRSVVAGQASQVQKSRQVAKNYRKGQRYASYRSRPQHVLSRPVRLMREAVMLPVRILRPIVIGMAYALRG